MNKEQCLRSLTKGASGISAPVFLDTVHKEFPVGEVKLSSEELACACGMSPSPSLSRTVMMGIMAVSEALGEANLHDSGLALVSGTTVAGMDVTERYYPDKLTRDVMEAHECGVSTNAIADHFGFFDFTDTISTACSSALNAIIFGSRLIRSGLRDVVVVGGSEALSRFHLNGFKSLMILDIDHCRPFDALRNGLNLGEGAAYMVLESEESIRRRGVRPLAELTGGCNACDAYHQTASSPTGEGAFRAMSGALKDAALKPTDIQYVNAHGTGTQNNDASESAALRRVFGAEMPPVSSTKGFTGHTTSASGSIEAVFCLMALRHQFIPKSLGFSEKDADCIRPYSSGEIGKPLRNVMCNSFGFGGNDSSIILSAYGE